MLALPSRVARSVKQPRSHTTCVATVAVVCALALGCGLYARNQKLEEERLHDAAVENAKLYHHTIPANLIFQNNPKLLTTGWGAACLFPLPSSLCLHHRPLPPRPAPAPGAVLMCTLVLQWCRHGGCGLGWRCYTDGAPKPPPTPTSTPRRVHDHRAWRGIAWSVTATPSCLACIFAVHRMKEGYRKKILGEQHCRM